MSALALAPCWAFGRSTAQSFPQRRSSFFFQLLGCVQTEEQSSKVSKCLRASVLAALGSQPLRSISRSTSLARFRHVGVCFNLSADPKTCWSNCRLERKFEPRAPFERSVVRCQSAFIGDMISSPNVQDEPRLRLARLLRSRRRDRRGRWL
jgi:hypothetical protein